MKQFVPVDDDLLLAILQKGQKFHDCRTFGFLVVKGGTVPTPADEGRFVQSLTGKNCEKINMQHISFR